MMGEESFNIIESKNFVTGSYYPEVMKCWKSFIGFSGTINDITLQ